MSYEPSSEAYGFPREEFPIEWNGHLILLLENNAHVTVDGLLEVHINLHCKWCESDSIFRWRFAPKYSEYDRAASFSKLLVLNPFNDSCDGVEDNSLIP